MAAEKSFENQVKKIIDDHGGWYIKYWAGASYTKTGIPDILACIDGDFYGIEIKAERGRPTLIQLVKLRQIREAGGIGLLLYPKHKDGFKAFINKFDADWYKENITLQQEWFKKLNV